NRRSIPDRLLGLRPHFPYPIKFLRVAGVIVTERTWPRAPRGFNGMSLTFKVRPAALPTEMESEFSAVNLRVIPGSRMSPPFAEFPSDVTLSHVFSMAWTSSVSVCGLGGGDAGSGSDAAGRLAAAVV